MAGLLLLCCGRSPTAPLAPPTGTVWRASLRAERRPERVNTLLWPVSDSDRATGHHANGRGLETGPSREGDRPKR